jgi:hypothetical protein
MEFPRMVYRIGTQQALESGRYDVKVITADALDQAIDDGWHLDQYAAKAAGEKPVSQAPEGASPNPFDTDPPTREELETKARELGLKFDGRTGDKKLAAMIAVALD